MLLYHGFLISTASSVRLPVEFYNAKATIFSRFCGQGVKIHEIGNKSASFLFISAILTDWFPLNWETRGFGACWIWIWSLFLSMTNGFFRNLTFIFLALNLWWENVNFLLSTSINMSISLFGVMTNKYRNKSKNNFEDTLKNKVFRAILASGGHTTPVWYDTYVK